MKNSLPRYFCSVFLTDFKFRSGNPSVSTSQEYTYVNYNLLSKLVSSMFTNYMKCVLMYLHKSNFNQYFTIAMIATWHQFGSQGSFVINYSNEHYDVLCYNLRNVKAQNTRKKFLLVRLLLYTCREFHECMWRAIFFLHYERCDGLRCELTVSQSIHEAALMPEELPRNISVHMFWESFDLMLKELCRLIFKEPSFK